MSLVHHPEALNAVGWTEHTIHATHDYAGGQNMRTVCGVTIVPRVGQGWFLDTRRVNCQRCLARIER